MNGPSLNLLGTREPCIYGTETLADIERRVRSAASELQVDVEFAQRNGEGDLIDCIHAWRGHVQGAVINPGAYGHTSLAIRDALAAVEVPYAEVHLTNIFAREPERHRLMLAGGAVAVLCGFGAVGYELALRGLAARLSSRG
ncbi:MAG TPA: type II 3-dehydroquinate dehydratase [Gemmatimonadaceae bacterium]|nr:type II 3-dehydroquinate dehydratase [Gemmatimonadaceae bacterium]